MNTSIRTLTCLLTACLLGCLTGYAYEQDNWYLANEWSVSSAQGVAYYEDNATGIGQIYVCNGSGSSAKISVYDLNGSLARNITIASARYNANDLVLDSNGTIYVAEARCVTCLENDGTFKWRTGKNASISSSGSYGSGNGEFNEARGIAIGPNGKIYVADNGNRRIQILDKSGSYLNKFGGQGTAPGMLELDYVDVTVLPNNIVLAVDYRRWHKFDLDGNFISRRTSQGSDYRLISSSKSGLSLSRSGQIFNSDMSVLATLPFSDYSRTCFTPDDDIIESHSSKIRIWKRAYRTKGLPQRNVIPQPAIRKVTQRTGTNVLDLDFEIVDTDDTNATVGIIAYCGNDKVVPQTWVDGTGSKINSPIATNQVHRVSWDVKQDWNTSTGEIKFEILCQDGRTNKPVDLHFLTLPFSDGNLTISRSPLKDSDFISYAKYLLAKGDAQFASTSSTAVTYAGSQILTSAWGVTAAGRSALLTALGSGYRWATTAEVTKAREAATPGAVNNWTASVQVKPRNLPGKVNEYGFDVQTTSGYWVVKE